MNGLNEDGELSLSWFVACVDATRLKRECNIGIANDAHYRISAYVKFQVISKARNKRPSHSDTLE